jgi:hypothetical protein
VCTWLWFAFPSLSLSLSLSFELLLFEFESSLTTLHSSNLYVVQCTSEGDEVYVLYVMMTFLALAYTDKVVVVIQQLAQELKIKVFRIPYGDQKKAKTN